MNCLILAAGLGSRLRGMSEFETAHAGRRGTADRARDPPRHASAGRRGSSSSPAIRRSASRHSSETGRTRRGGADRPGGRLEPGQRPFGARRQRADRRRLPDLDVGSSVRSGDRTRAPRRAARRRAPCRRPHARRAAARYRRRDQGQRGGGRPIVAIGKTIETITRSIPGCFLRRRRSPRHCATRSPTVAGGACPRECSASRHRAARAPWMSLAWRGSTSTTRDAMRWLGR